MYRAIIVVFCVFLVVWILKKKKNYWSSRGVYQIQPHFFFGNTKDVFLKRKSLGEKFQELYNHYKANNLKFAGAYVSSTPVLVPVDIDLIKNILQSDYASFASHGIYVDEENDPLTGQLFSLDGNKWKNMRNKLTPAFTSTKMKMMFETMLSSTENLRNLLVEESKLGPIEVKEIMARFTTDVIGRCAFGIECNSLKNPEAEFRKFGRKVFEPRFSTTMKMMAIRLLPKCFLQTIRFKLTKTDVELFFTEAIKETVESREASNVFRKDLMHLLLQLKNRGEILDDEKIFAEDFKPSAFTMTQLTAQCYGFFTAGFETSSTAMAFALYELAVNQNVQERVRDEINEVLKLNDDKLTYESVSQMKYLDRVILETLRLHPPIPGIPRQCTKPYQIPGSNVKIDERVRVHISILGIHMDPDIYPEPSKFDPDRFLDENKALRPACTFLPFGEGQRICIGLRFGMQQSKIGLISVVKNFRVSLDQKTEVPLKMEPASFINTARGGIWLNMEAL